MIRFLMITITFVFIFMVDSHASKSAYQGRLKFLDKERTQFKLGEIFAAELQLWPAHEIREKDVDYLQGKTLFNLFYVAAVYEKQLSENNQDVLLIKMLLVSTRPYQNMELYLFNHADRDYICSLSEVGTPKDKAIEIPKEFMILESSLPIKINWSLLIFSMFLFFGVIFLFYRRHRKNRLRMCQLEEQKAREKAERNCWMDKLKRACNREDFEMIFRTRGEWQVCLQRSDEDISRLIELIDGHQYRPHWTDEQLENLKVEAGNVISISSKDEGNLADGI